MMELIHQDRFEELKATGQLPSPKGVALAIINLMQRDDVTVADISHVVQTDPAMSGRLIKFANSAHQGVRRPVAAVAEAVLLLGLPLVRQLALGFSVLSSHRTGRCAGFDYESFWAHSLATAIANQMLSLYSQTAANETFTCGLMSRVGRLALATLFPEEYGEVLAEAAGKPAAELLRLEQERFAADHRDLTGALLKDWGLPVIFLEAVYHHGAPEQGAFVQGSRSHMLSRSLHFASCMAELCLADEQSRSEMLPRLCQLGEAFEMDEEGVAAFGDQVVAEWQEWGKILDIQTQTLPPFAAMAASLRKCLVTPGPEDSRDTDSPLRILIGADGAVRAALQDVLTNAGHLPVFVENHQDALHVALTSGTQLVIADLASGVDGLALCKALRATTEGRKIYFIVLTDSQEGSHLVEAFEGGVDDCLVKPFSERVLQARLRAGKRVIRLQEEVEREREEIRLVANELAITNRRLQQMALTDPLTLLPNRRYGMEHLAQEWASSLRSGRPLACLLVDVDRFKQINDTHGHDVGDAVLRQGAAILKESCRKQDLVSRLGGEEFMVVCPDSDLEAAARCAERIRSTFEAASIQVDGATCRMTVSIGVGARGKAMEHGEALLKVVDQALYAAKQAGRNRVVCVRPSSDNGAPAFKILSRP
jgi:two-component system cell cycle response regulator